MRLNSMGVLFGIAVSVSACGPRRFFTTNRAAVLADRVPAQPVALAREVRWVFHRRIDRADRYFADPETRKKIATTETHRITIPKATRTTAEMFYDRGAKPQAERALREQRLFDDAIDQASFATSEIHLLKLDLLSDDPATTRAIEDVLLNALIAHGFIDQDAPENSVLYVVMAIDSSQSKLFTGRQNTWVVAMNTARDTHVTASSGRQLIERRYEGNVPATAPAGFAEIDESEPDDYEMVELESLVRSAAIELSNAISL
jgi:hypothetical protein